MGLRDRLSHIWDGFLSQPRHDLVLRITLFLLLVHGTSSLMALIPLRILCGLMLISRKLHNNQAMWIAICAALVFVNARNWYWIDNHKYLIMYWSLACCLSLFSRDPDRLLAWNGRVLIGVTFLFATGWKIMGGQFLDGSFFHFVLLTDETIKKHVLVLGGLTLDDLSFNRELLQSLIASPQQVLAPAFISTPRTEGLSLVFSYLTILVEGAIAVTFLLGTRRWFAAAKDNLLILFCLLTYYALPIVGFAITLMVMGFAQCPAERRDLRILYLWVLVLVQTTLFPFGEFFS